MKDEILTTLLTKANKTDGVILRDYFEKVVPEPEREEVENFLFSKDIIVVDEILEDIKEEIEVDKVIPKKLVGSNTHNFLKAISKYKRLSDYDERELIKKVESGRQAKKLLAADDGSLSEFEKKNLNIRVEQGLEARDIIIYSYHTYVLDIVNKYVRYGGKGNISYEDMVQAGFEGLVDAFESFDCKRENKLATWARYIVMNSVQELMASTRNALAVPKTAQFNRMKITKIINNFELTHGRKPTDDELCSELGYDGLSEKAKKKKMASVKTLIESSMPTVNLDKKVSNDEESDSYDKFIPADTKSPLEKFVAEQNKKELYVILNKVLNEREIKIVYHRNGLEGLERKTLEELGKEFGLTRERVRQIEEEAYAKLRDSEYRYILFEMLPR